MAVRTAGLEFDLVAPLAAGNLAAGKPVGVLGITDRGRIRTGYWADLTVLSDDLSVLATVVRGQFTHGSLVG